MTLPLLLHLLGLFHCELFEDSSFTKLCYPIRTSPRQKVLGAIFTPSAVATR